MNMIIGIIVGGIAGWLAGQIMGSKFSVLGNIITSDLAVRLTYITVSRYVNQAI